MAMTVAAALAGMLVLGAVPVLAGGPQDNSQPTQTLTVQTASTAGDQAAKPADQTKPADKAKPADQAKPADTAKPAAATAKPVSPTALTKNSYGGGFRMTTENGKYSMRIMAAAQFRYTYMNYDDRVSGNTEDYSNFYMRRARVWFDGHAYDPKFTYYIHVQLEPMSAVNLHDAWINYALKPMFQIGLGRNKIAYGLEFVNSGFGNNMVERSIYSGETDINAGGGLSKWPGGGNEGFPLSGEDANTGYQVGGLQLFRSQGVQLSGRNKDTGGVFEYQVGVWQGRNTKGASNFGTDHLYSARVGFYPNGFINWLFAGDNADTKSFKTGFVFSAYNDTRIKKTNAAGTAVPQYEGKDTGYTLSLMARYRGFSLDADYGWEQYDMQDSTVVGDKEFDRNGWRAQVGYFVKPKLVEVVGRYAYVTRLADPTIEATKNSGLGFVKVKNSSGVLQDAMEKSLQEYTFGVNYYLSGAAQQHKVFADYSHLTRQFAGFVSGNTVTGGVSDQGDDRVRLMLQMKF
jgi:hypothetical protein